MKLCKFCKEQIPLGALVSKFCSREVNTAEEASRLTRTHMEEVVARWSAARRRCGRLRRAHSKQRALYSPRFLIIDL